MSLFDRVKVKTYKRTAFPLSHSIRTTLNIGQVVPTGCWECVPGDTFKFGQVATLELQPLISPFYGELWQESLAFFVSYDSLEMASDGGSFTELLKGVTDPQHDALPVPKWNMNKTDVDSSNVIKSTKIGSLWDKMGFPLNLTALDDDVTPIAYPQRAYNMVANEYILDENQDTPVNLDDNNIITCCYKKDLFTSAFDSPQKGTAPYLELTGSASAVWSNDILNELVGLISNYQEIRSGIAQGTGNKVAAESTKLQGTISTGSSASPNTKLNGSVSTYSSGAAQDSDLGVKINQAFLDLLNNNSLNMSQIITFNIDDLRLLNKLQLWLERNQIVGTRTKEYLLANYGIAPSDETLQRPVFLGRLRTPVKITTTIAQSQTATLPQGHKTGNGSSSQAVMFKKWHCKEPGLIIIVSFVRPKISYSQGINRMWIKPSVYDYFNPIFENLGQQGIYNAEIYADGSANDNGIFGYTDRYNELKYIPDITCGELRANQSLQSWSISRHFAQLPTLSSAFLHVNATDYDYLFQVKSTTAPQIIGTYDNVVKGIRPLHRFAMPSL